MVEKSVIVLSYESPSRNLIRVLAGRSLDNQGFNVASHGQRRPSCVDASIYLNLYLTHVSYENVPHVVMPVSGSKYCVNVDQSKYGKCPAILNTLFHTLCLHFCFLCSYFLKTLSGKANSVDPDQTTPSKAA